ncbi:transcription-repair coupling factor [Bombilactobacillus folatiphilus]|uniref:Transcription-repair-coupling factor n=1 Tax=Bombilactobacillus folatiphilus TaxID=2923362 RepID=A0ABY4PAG7_9LACO|nr:transcription-repair coupling factor [Bombilactobacillus folatiphilus]UQS82332.1 transcription-repair coupling factor [Bombilactobacillus folatiphilus]
MQLIDFLEQNQTLHDFVANLLPQTHQVVTGLNGSAKALFLATVAQQTQQPLLVVVDDNYHANLLMDDLQQLLPTEQLYHFDVEAPIAMQMATSSPEALSQRLLALEFLGSQQAGVVVTSVAGLEFLLPTPQQFAAAQIKIAQNQEIVVANLGQQLVDLGYRRQNLVMSPGEFAIRGDIVDFYPLTMDKPIRVEFFGDEVDAIHTFDPETQRSQDELTETLVLPASDYLVDDKRLQIVGELLEQQLTTEIGTIKDPELIQNLKHNFQSDIEQLQHGVHLEQLGQYVSLLYPKPATLVDYLSSSGIIIYDDLARLNEQERTNLEENSAWVSGRIETGKLLGQQRFRWSLAEVIDEVLQAKLDLTLFQKTSYPVRLNQLLNLNTRTVQQFFSNLPLLKTEIQHWQVQGYTIVLLLSVKSNLQKIQRTLADFEISSTQSTLTRIEKQQTQLIAGGLHTGIDFLDEKLVIITEKELFNKQPQRRRQRSTISNAERLKSYTDLKPGDYVVHVNHGIGKFLGTQTLEVDGKHQDYMTIEYRDDGKLFIPVTQLNMVQKYVSAKGKAPRMNKLGGTEWHKTKQKVQKNIEDIADDLVKLYAQRESEPGFAFAPDDDLQHQFDEQFAYVETPDQLRSIEEVKADMEKPHPMERLLVGDVGFGKTEVALRAAFKAVNNGKQVAFLVPTTILAQQHYQTMLERFEGFPVKIAIMSRFQTATQQRKTKAGLADGSVDIVVGTHRLLSKDIEFLDLGLLIIDEEQRFGVKHKERLKQLKSQIDVLSMTATPIPRTLNMSMMGVRDLSVIETAPPNRYPIQTFVMEQNYDVIRSAILREMERGGQVFYLHNRVEDMEQVVSILEGLIPDVRVGIANGQMTENQLEAVITNFLNGEYDVLVTTTIIETGVDIANANTLIVENADHYGLSQLYQLRGRVGRSSRVAYAYLMYRPDKTLTEVGEKRLEAVKNFTELGSGFKIAMQDLAIRGSGNLLGQQQHGFIDSVGYDLYTQMLNEAVAKKRRQQSWQAKTNAAIRLDVEAYLPSAYISDERQKIEMYKRLREAKDLAQVQQLRQELLDRFGKFPKEVANLLAMTQIKVLADQALINKITQVQSQVQIVFDPMANRYLVGEQIFANLATTQLKAQVANEHGYFIISLKMQPQVPLLTELEAFLQPFAEQAQQISEK